VSDLARVYIPGTEPARLTTALDVPAAAGKELATTGNSGIAVLDVRNLSR
jgi:hypothetical protein